MKLKESRSHQLSGANPMLNRLDQLGIITSALCLIHCWSFPILLLFFPGIFHAHEWAHPVFAGLALISFLAFLSKKKSTFTDKIFFATACVGILMIASGIFVHHHHPIADITMNSIGGLLLLAAHGKNMLRH